MTPTFDLDLHWFPARVTEVGDTSPVSYSAVEIIKTDGVWVTLEGGRSASIDDGDPAYSLTAELEVGSLCLMRRAASVTDAAIWELFPDRPLLAPGPCGSGSGSGSGSGDPNCLDSVAIPLKVCPLYDNTGSGGADVVTDIMVEYGLFKIPRSWDTGIRFCRVTDQDCCEDDDDAGSGGGGQLITVDCCEEPIPSRLYATISGECTFINGTYVLDYDPTQPRYLGATGEYGAWIGGPIGNASNGYFWMEFSPCGPIVETWVLYFRVGSPLGNPSQNMGSALPSPCSPFLWGVDTYFLESFGPIPCRGWAIGIHVEISATAPGGGGGGGGPGGGEGEGFCEGFTPEGPNNDIILTIPGDLPDAGTLALVYDNDPEFYHWIGIGGVSGGAWVMDTYADEEENEYYMLSFYPDWPTGGASGWATLDYACGPPFTATWPGSWAGSTGGQFTAEEDVP